MFEPCLVHLDTSDVYINSELLCCSEESRMWKNMFHCFVLVGVVVLAEWTVDTCQKYWRGTERFLTPAPLQPKIYHSATNPWIMQYTTI